MKKRIVSMILALSMMLSILPVSAFADAGAGLPSAVAEETNSITYSSENEHEAVGTNSETNNQVVKIKTGTNGLPKAATGTGWSYDETTGLTITGTGSEDTEYILDGTVSCNVTVKNANSYTVYLLDGTVTGTLLIEADNMYGVYVLGGSYADVELNLGTIDGGTYDKLTENGGNVRGGFFRDISGLSASTQQQAHQLLLPENCTLNGQKETKIYIIKKYSYTGTGKNLELAVESDTGCDVWAVASTGGSVMALPAGTQNYAFTYFGSTIATVSISPDGKTLSASFNMIPAQDDAPMKLVPMVLGATELRFNNEGQPDLTDVTHVDSLDTDAKLHRVYMGNGWGYNCYPNDSSKESTLQILDRGGADFDFSKLSNGPINCPVEITNANITGGEFGENGRLNIYSGKISGGSFHNVSTGISSINGNSAVEITGGTFDSLFCNGSCSITNAVIQSCNFNTYGNNTYTISNTVLGELPDGIQKLLAAGQQISTLVVRNGNVTAMNGRTLPLSTNTIYLVGAGSAELTLNTDVLSINEAPVSSYNAYTSADGKVLRITGNNDGAEIFVNKSTDASALKPLRITEEGLPDLTDVTGVPVSGEGMTITLYEGLGWKYATTKENGRTRAALYVTSPDGNPVDLASDTINPYHKAIAVEQITFANVTVTGIVAEGSVSAQNTIIQDGTFQKDVYMDENSTIAGGSFYDVVRAYGTITGGAFIAEVQLNKNSEVTGGVFHDVQLPNYASEKTVIQNAMILGSLKTDSDSKAAVSNTVSCGYIESKYLAAGQQQSKLMMTDGTVERLNDYAAATDAVYLIGNVKAEIRFSNAVTNINGAEASDYNKGTSAMGCSLTITAKNDGEPIVVNVAATGKLPFSSLSKSDFTVSGTIEHQTVTSSKEGVGELSLVSVRTDNNAELDHFPSQTEYGSYKVYIEATEGERYTAGRVLITEEPIVRKYRPTIGNFSLDLDAGTATYTGPKYYGNAVPKATLKYSATNDLSTATETVPTEAGTYYVWLVVENSQYYDGSNDQLPDGYTVAEKLPFEGFEVADFETIDNEDGTYTLVCTKAEGVGKLTVKFECITGVNKGAIFINREPNLYGRYRGTIIAEEGTKYKAGSIELGEESLRYTPEAKDFTYDATKNTVEYTGTNYYDADPQMTLLYGTDQSETVPTAPGSYDVYVKVTAGKNYIADAHAEVDYRIYQVGTYVVPEPTSYTLTVNGKPEQRDFDENVTVTAPEKDGYTFTGWEAEGVPEGTDTTKATITFKMPANNVTLKPQYEKNTYTLTVDGVDEPRVFDENVTVAAPEKDGCTFTGWEVTGLPADVDTTKATISFKMPANNVTLKAQYTENAPKTYTVTMGEEVKDYAVDADVSITAPEKDGYTFTGWEVTGLPADVDTTKATITFKMPANNVTLKPQYEKNSYILTVDGKLEPRVFDENVTVTAPEKDGCTFTGWEVDGVPEGTDTTKATITFKMPANNVTLKPQYEKNTYTLTVNGKPEQRTVGEEVTLIARKPEGMTFSYWEIKKGLAADAVDVRSEKITFTMPANDVTISAIYVKDPTPDPDPEIKTHELKVSNAQIFLKDGSDVADLKAVPVGTELKAIAYADTETSVFKSWSCTGLKLTEEQSTAREVYFTMPDHDVSLTAAFVTPAKPEPETYKVSVSNAKITLKDGSDVTDLTAVRAGTELVATAPEKDGYTFTGWEVTGLPADVDTTKATITFKMPANNVTLKPQYEKNTYTLTVDGVDEPRVFDENVTVTAPEKDGFTFTGWEVTGLPADVDTTKATISFTMPANNVTLKAQYTENAPKTYKLDVSDATITLKDGSDVTDLTAVRVGTELVATADEDTETRVFKNWNCTGLELTEEQRTARVVEFTMPDHDVELTAVFEVPATPDPDPTPAPSDDGGGAVIVAVAAVGGAAIGVGAYIAGTTAYLKSVLPEGMAIPANRQQLAVALWTAAGKPATQSTALFNDVAADAAELQAIRWVVETGLMSAQDGNFKPGSRVGRMEVIRTWKAYQQRG